MSKRTTPSTPPSENPAPRRRAAKPAAAEAKPKVARSRRKTSTPEVVATAESLAIVTRSAPSHDEIATRAYFISLEQGADPLAAWLRAEHELTSA